LQKLNQLMYLMEQKIFELLQTKFAGVADNILHRIAAKLAKTAKTDEEAEDAVADFSIQQLLEANGDYRANEAQVSAVKNYEKKHGLKDGQKIESSAKVETDVKPADDDDVPSWAKTMMAELAAIKGEKITNTRKAAVEEIIKDLPNTIKKAYSRIDVTSLSDDEFDALKGEIKAEVGDIVKDDSSKRTVFGIPKVGSGDDVKASETAAEEIVSKMNF